MNFFTICPKKKRIGSKIEKYERYGQWKILEVRNNNYNLQRMKNSKGTKTFKATSFKNHSMQTIQKNSL